ncbi:hypothetical protein TRFO_26690 [Tritrichomonas foetus]|uniref:Initiator binding domain-containing protein n=1 Tax=Tritrichomonas foetus TaxID=1144522 RepID=A0A1J4K2X4_9EUKA|nr:hypothetical protein TRFO_26690 [Tritrichomonas foetus]|eukprot:OHT05547.1 hypothetical protein TRFO_26690 [Tritrichomonas foetus]
MSFNQQSQNMPKFWWMISEADRVSYSYVRAFIKNNPESNQRNKRLSSFTEMLNVVRSYAIRGDSGDNNRCLVCGILWLPGAIAINTHQLGFLLSKCKSSINGSLQILGYKEKITRKTASDLVANSLTAIRDDRSELRKWTVRCLDDSILDLPAISESQILPQAINHDSNDLSTESNKLNSRKNNERKVSTKNIEKITDHLTFEKTASEKVDDFTFDTIFDPKFDLTNSQLIKAQPVSLAQPNQQTPNSQQLQNNQLLSELNFDDIDFSKEDAILNQALRNYNEEADTQNNFWSIDSVANDCFFM